MRRGQKKRRAPHMDNALFPGPRCAILHMRNKCSSRGKVKDMAEVELRQIGPYSVTALLHESATSTLYRGKRRHQELFIKRLNIALTTAEAREAFLSRARQLKKLVHRNIVHTLDAGFDGDYGYLVMEYAAGETLRQRIQPGERIAPDQVKSLLTPIADALSYAHASNALHGNLHPGNLLAGAHNAILLTEFALSLPGAGVALDEETLAVPYMAPEHLRGQPCPASDQYSLDVMAYEWLCGQRPYAATEREGLLRQQEEGPFRAPRSLNDAISPAVEQVIVRALARSPEERFPHALAFAEQYLRALMGLPISTDRHAISSNGSRSAERAASVAATSEGQEQNLEPAKGRLISFPAPAIPRGREPGPVSKKGNIVPFSGPVRDDETGGNNGKHNEVTPPAQLSSVEASTDGARLQSTVAADLRQGGILSRSLPGYEERPAQIEMAMLVARSLTQNVPAIVEAGTGTGKSLSYLLPIVRSGKVAIVSTANKALQEQLFFKDIPFVQKYIRHFDAALVKGMGNYICLDRVEQERVGIQHYVKNPDFQRLLERIENSDERFTGDFEMLGFTLPADIRAKVNADRDQCTWSKCSYFSECFVRRMKARASQASVIVVNHTLLLLDAFMEGNLLPERDVIIIDEAHHLEDEATRAFTTTVSQGRISTLLAQHLLKDHTPPALQEETKDAMIRAWDRLARVADPGYKGRANLKEPLQEGLNLASMIAKLAEALRTGRPKQMTEKDEQLYDKLISRAQNLSEDVRIAFAVDRPEKYVYYVEKVTIGGRRGLQQLEVSAAPLEVTGWLKEHLFDKSNVICTSATLA